MPSMSCFYNKIKKSLVLSLQLMTHYQNKILDRIDASVGEDEPKEKNVFDTLKVILKKVKHEVNSDTQGGSSDDDSKFSFKLDSTNDIEHNLVNETPIKLSDENVLVESQQNTTDKSKLKATDSDMALDLIDVSTRDSFDNSQSLKKGKEDNTKLFNTPKPSSEQQEQVTGKLTFNTIFESLYDAIAKMNIFYLDVSNHRDSSSVKMKLKN
ncbi:hypothetical protein Anas_06766 [Armadillidium nasatum]|uniref:Uncharacterized protein n=1 Tax=Armadillidium nasatum TaxID=96803 RepID=A0A5N5SPI0_9CRUS|nr:hypothetical protein Anas_06766 [Armadillidium nasatum]